MANAGCINAIGFDGTLIQTLQQLDSSNIGVGVQYCAPNPLDDKRFDYIKYTDKCGCTCCLTGENEIMIYATQGVIKNLTLTNDDTNEVVNVKRTDLFGSNRKKTVVRYKTGSYPTSITDGTLAVEETTMNQYQSSGYNVSGLSDATTYYFTAFAVAQDDTIIVVQGSTVQTSFFLNKYQRVEYIQRNGNNYIDSLRIPKITTNFEVKIGVKIATSGVRYNILGNHNQGQTGQTDFEINAGGITNNKARMWSKGGTPEDFFSSNSLNTNSFNDLVFKSNGSTTQTIIVNGTATTATLSGATFQNYSAYFFIDRELRRSTFTANLSISYCQIYEGGTLVKDFFPAYRKSDNAIGMVEKVNKEFYMNKGSGTFVKGGNISR